MKTRTVNYFSATRFTFLIFLVRLALCPKVEGKTENVQDLRLELVQVVFRHGSRTPEYPYYNDPNINETFHPFGWDALDTAGHKGSYQLGQYLKKRYGDFITDYDPAIVKIWSTSSLRTNLCAQLVAAGLFPPKSIHWDDPGTLGYLWQPVAIDSTNNPLNNDYLMNSFKLPCPAYDEQVHEMSDGPMMQAIIDSDPELYDAFINNAYSPHTEIDAIMKTEPVRIYATMAIEESWNLTVPDWAKPFYPNRMKDYADKIYALSVKTDKMLRLRIGAFLEHLIAQMNIKEQGSKQTVWLYSGHDVSVSNLGAILGFWEGITTEFNSAILLELYSNPEGRYFVKTFFRNDTSKDPILMTVSGCRNICPLNQFRNLFERFIPVNLVKECLQVERNAAVAIHIGLLALVCITLLSCIASCQ